MKQTFFNSWIAYYRWIGLMLAMLSSIAGWGQEKRNAVEELVEHGFENVRWTENEDECIYTIENNVYKAEGVGISKAIDIIQKHGLPTDKRCKVIVTHLEVPELSLTYHPNRNDSTETDDKAGWQTSYEIGQSWNSIKKEKAKNSSRVKVDILIYLRDNQILE